MCAWQEIEVREVQGDEFGDSQKFVLSMEVGSVSSEGNGQLLLALVVGQFCDTGNKKDEQK